MNALLQKFLVVVLIATLLAGVAPMNVAADGIYGDEFNDPYYPYYPNGAYVVDEASQLPEHFFLFDATQQWVNWESWADREWIFSDGDSYKMLVMGSATLVFSMNSTAEQTLQLVNVTKVTVISEGVQVYNPQFIYIDPEIPNMDDLAIVVDGNTLFFGQTPAWIVEYDHIRPAKFYADKHSWVLAGQHLNLKDTWIMDKAESYQSGLTVCMDLKDWWYNEDVDKREVKKHCGSRGWTWAQEYGGSFEPLGDEVTGGSFGITPPAYITFPLRECGITYRCGATLPSKNMQVRVIMQIANDGEYSNKFEYWAEVQIGTETSLYRLSDSSTNCYWLFGQNLKGVYSPLGEAYIPPADVCFAVRG